MTKEKVNSIIRLIASIVLIMNMALTLMGKNPIPFDETVFTEWATIGAAIFSSIWSWWKDAPMTSAGANGHAVTVAEKKGEDIEVIYNDAVPRDQTYGDGSEAEEDTEESEEESEDEDGSVK